MSQRDNTGSLDAKAVALGTYAERWVALEEAEGNFGLEEALRETQAADAGAEDEDGESWRHWCGDGLDCLRRRYGAQGLRKF